MCFIALEPETARGFISTQEIYFSISWVATALKFVNIFLEKATPHILVESLALAPSTATASMRTLAYIR